MLGSGTVGGSWDPFLRPGLPQLPGLCAHVLGAPGPHAHLPAPSFRSVPASLCRAGPEPTLGALHSAAEAEGAPQSCAPALQGGGPPVWGGLFPPGSHPRGWLGRVLPGAGRDPSQFTQGVSGCSFLGSWDHSPVSQPSAKDGAASRSFSQSLLGLLMGPPSEPSAQALCAARPTGCSRVGCWSAFVTPANPVST